MPFAFTHLVGAWIPGKIYEFFSNYKFRKLEWFFILLGAVIPDFTILIDKILETQVHRSFSHSLLSLSKLSQSL